MLKKEYYIVIPIVRNFTFTVLALLFLVQCNAFEEPDTSNFGYDFYPVEIGQYRIYYTRYIDYALDGSIDTTNYLTQEVVEDSVRYADGSLKYILGRYSMGLEGTEWHKDSLWAAYIDHSNVVISEANVDYVKLSFPVKETLQWDGNGRNSRDKEIYELDNLRQPYSYDTLNYENTLTVVQADLVDPNKITEDDYRIEVFASGIGLVHKLKKKINYCDPTKCSENGIIESGAIFEQKLIEFGKN